MNIGLHHVFGLYDHLVGENDSRHGYIVFHIFDTPHFGLIDLVCKKGET